MKYDDTEDSSAMSDKTSIYLDNNATTHVLPEVQAAILECLDTVFGNPSSAHEFGRHASAQVEAARDHLAALMGCAEPERITFTSGGTEANNTVLLGVIARCGTGGKIVASRVEHSSIVQLCRSLETSGTDIHWIPVDSHGLIDFDLLEKSIDSETVLVSIQWANSETGVIQDVERIGRLCREKGVLFHADAAQALGKAPVTADEVPVDFLTVAGHKIHAPKGVGAIYARDPENLSPLLIGGDQEQGRRAGTENVPGIVGFGEAARLRRLRFSSVLTHLSFLRNTFEEKLKSLGMPFRVNGQEAQRNANTSNVLFLGVEGLALVGQLDREGIYCSQSSACTNHRPEPSYVLTEMGLTEEEAFSSLRFCFSEENSLEEIDVVIHSIGRALTSLAA